MTVVQTHIQLVQAEKKKQLAMLIDPDKVDLAALPQLAQKIISAKVDLIFVGGSLITNNQFDQTIKSLKQLLDIPVIIFPGNAMQVSSEADAILLLSLISGRNPEFLIGQHVHAAPILKASKLEIMPTGYILIDGGAATAVSYMSNTQPIPSNKPEIAACTALAGEMLGLKNIYLEAGSGANQAVSLEVIQAVKSQISIPLIVGGGIRNAAAALAACQAGADIIVVGTAFEEDENLIPSIAKSIHSL